MSNETIAIFDFGSQYTQLIARRIRELGVYTEILPGDASLELIAKKKIKGVILSGGPGSVTGEELRYDANLFQLDLPLLGICFGMQLMNHHYRGAVRNLSKGEFGRQQIEVDGKTPLFEGLPVTQIAWMSHGESIEGLSDQLKAIAKSEEGIVAGVAHVNKPQYGLQFHPEVTHSEKGRDILRNFIRLCGCQGDWTLSDYIEEAKEKIREQVGDGNVVSLVSGGVDSTVATTLCFEALGKDRVIPIHIDSGLMRDKESQEVVSFLKKEGMERLDFVDASEMFLSALSGVTSPEEKRKVIGEVFIEILEGELEKVVSKKTFLCQGTLYTDLIESGKGCGTKAKVIKSHHNVNPPLIQKKREEGLVVEPNSGIFKDEVRKVGALLNIPETLLWRHPFPGPGLAIRIMGEVTNPRLNRLRQADRIYMEELEKAGLNREIWQAFCVYLPVNTVGVKGDQRFEGDVIALRAITSEDGMTADIYPFRMPVLERVSARICNEVEGVCRTVYDLTSKPPGTIEWE